MSITATGMSPRKVRKLVRAYERSLAADPDNLVLRLKLAFALRQSERDSEALALYLGVARAYVERGRLVQAAAVCRGVLAIAPENHDAAALLACAETPLAGVTARGGSSAPREAFRQAALSTLPPQRLEYPVVRTPPPVDSEVATGPGAGEDDEASTGPGPSRLRPMLSDPGELPDGAPLFTGSDPVLQDDPALDPALDPSLGLVASTAPVPLFCALPREALVELVHRLETRRFHAGDVIVREGEDGDACFVVAAGFARVIKSTPDGGAVEVGRLGAGDLFGEFAVLSDLRRHATVIAEEGVELLVITRRVLGILVERHPEAATAMRRFYRQRLFQNLLATAPFLRALEAADREALAPRFRFRRVAPGVRIVSQGEEGGGLRLVLVGRVAILCADPSNSGAVRRVGTLGEGSYFGEMSLLRGDVACASVVAEEPTELVELPPRDFYEVVGRYPALWRDLYAEAQRRELANSAILAGDVAVG